MRLLALDMATKTGWANNLFGKVDTSGVQDFSLKRGESAGMRLIKFRAWLSNMVELIKPEVIVYEQGFSRGGAATDVAVGLKSIMLVIAEENGIEVSPYEIKKIKKFATGNGNANKEKMMKAYFDKWGRPPIDDNECDAKWLLELAKSEICL